MSTISRRHRRQRQTSKALTSPTACCDCIPSKTGARNSIQLSDIYSPQCPPDHITNSPECLSTITKQKHPDQIKTLLNVESEIEYSKNFNKKLSCAKKSPLKGKNKSKAKTEQEIYEIGSEAADDDDIETAIDISNSIKIGIMTENDKKNMIRVNGKEELPCVDDKDDKTKKCSNNRSLSFLKKSFECKKSPKKANKSKIIESSNNINNNNNTDDTANNGTRNESLTNDESDGNNNCDEKEADNVKYSTLPLMNKQKLKKAIAIPQRITPDGTKILYLCDLPKKVKRGWQSFSISFDFT